MATFGSFPGVRVQTQSGGVASVSIGEEEKLVIFGESNYSWDDSADEILVEGDDTSLSVSANSPEQINAPREADAKFGSDSELADAMKEALQNGANIDFLYGVPVGRTYVEAESHSSATGVLDNFPIRENTGDPVDVAGDSLNDMGIDAVGDSGNGATLSVEFRYNPGPSQPTADDTLYINPQTGDFAVSSNVTLPFEVDYTYPQWNNAFSASDVRNIVNEDETGIYLALAESDSVSSDLDTEVSSLRDDYQLINAFMVAEPNDQETLDASNTTDANGGADARYDTSNYSSANQSINANYFYKFAPGRLEDVEKTIGGGVGGLFAGNPINDPVYNEVVSGYNTLEQSFSKSDADNMRSEDIIPVRSAGSVRIKGNRSTNYGASDSVAADFWVRRITDRVILIGKQIGDDILGNINDPDTRADAERAIEAEMRELVGDRLIKSNENEKNWRVDVYESSTNSDEVNIDIAFTPFGIVKRVDETITVNTN